MIFIKTFNGVLFVFFCYVTNVIAVDALPKSKNKELLPAVVNTSVINDERYDCLVEPYEQVLVSSEVSGVVDRYFVERGDRVKRGQKLAVLRAGIERAAVELTKAKVEFGERKVLRNKELLEKELISEHERDELETENRVAALELEEMQAKLKMRSIYSPIKGVVVERHNSAGEYVGADPILTLAQVDPLSVEVVVPVEKFGTITKGMKAEVSPVIPADTKVVGKVVIVDSVIDAASGTFGVRVKIANRRHKLAAGVKCQIKFLH